MNRYVAYKFIRVSSNEKCQINLRNITAIKTAMELCRGDRTGCELLVWLFLHVYIHVHV